MSTVGRKKTVGLNVLSLFDGMSCGQIALERCGIEVDNYFASEIDKYAIQVTKKNYPNTIHIGDVTKVKGGDLPKIDLLIGGSPCQGFSFAGKQLNFDDPRSKLFFEYGRLLKECNPKYFLLENVKMKKEYQDVISECMGVEPIEINSSSFVPQHRVRLYWTNISFDYIHDCREKNYEDILEDDPHPKYNLTERMIQQMYRYEKPITNIDISPTITTEFAHQIGRDNTVRMFLRTYKLTGVYRKSTPIELERLQGVSDNYTEGVSDSQRYKMLGNGWTVDVIEHIFRGLLK